MSDFELSAAELRPFTTGSGWARGALEHDQVTDTRELREPIEQPTGEARRGHDADVQHQLRGVAEGSAAAVGPAVVAGLAAACAAVGGFGASAGAILAAAT
jgi:hypothetical protein